MAILPRLLTSHLLLRLGQIGRLPVRAILVHSRLKLAELLGGTVELEFGNVINIYEVVGFLRRRIEEVHFWHFIRLQTLLQTLIRKVEPELSRAHGVNGIECSHAMVCLVPALIPLTGIYAEQHIGTHTTDDRSGFFHELRLRRVLQHAVVIAQPCYVLFWCSNETL